MLPIKLTVKQQKFADEYIKSGNATQAAILAGYSQKTARVTGQENLLKPAIKTYIDKRLEEISDETIADAKDVMQFLTKVMLGKVQDTTLIGLGMGEQEITKIDVSVKDQIKAAELIGKRYALFTDKVQQTNANIEIDIGGWEDET